MDSLTRFITREMGFSPELCGLEELTELRLFRRRGRRDGSETTMIAVHISAILQTYNGTNAFCSNARQRPMLTAIVIKPRPNVTQRATTCRLDKVRVDKTGNGRRKINISEEIFKAKLTLNSL